MGKGTGGGASGRAGGFRIGQRITDGLITGRVTSVGSIRYGRQNLPAYRIQTNSGRTSLIIAEQARRAGR